MGPADFVVFLAFVMVVMTIGLWQSKGEKTHGAQDAQDYFLAGRGLTWWLVGFSLIAANISTEQFVGMSGKAADWLGMAIASYEWMAAITLVVVAFAFLPTFLRSGIYTMPEFLEYRFNYATRLLMAVLSLIVLVGVPTASVIYSGAKVITGNFQGVVVPGLNLDLGNITVGCCIIGALSAVYVFAGGLKACAWADLLQGSGLILGGAVIAVFALHMLSEASPETLMLTARNTDVTVASLEQAGPLQRFWDLNRGPLPEGKTHMVRDLGDKEIPWSALVIGLWIPNFFYWGFNQYITQRTLGSKSLAEGQKGIVFAAFLKLIVPFIVVVPGILAFNLFNADLQDDAVNRNAQVLAEYSPPLYRRLSDGMKPNRQDVRTTQIVERIDTLLDAEPRATGTVHLYQFGVRFAERHRDDAAAVVAFNREQLAGKVPLPAVSGSEDPPEQLAQASAAVIQAARERLADVVKVDELVAHDYDNAFPTLIRQLLPVGSGIKGFVLAAIFGAVVSTLASMLNSASTIAAMDIYHKVHRSASQYTLVTVGRVCVVLFVVIATLIAPWLGHPSFGGIFTYIQEFQGFITSGVLAVFLFGVLVHRAPRMTGLVGLLVNPLVYGLLKQFRPDIAFLDRTAISFFVVVGVLAVLTWLWPLEKPVSLPVNPSMDMRSSRSAKAFGLVVVLVTLALYVVFW